MLKDAGIETRCGILREEALGINRPFVKFMKKRIPFVTVKMAQSLDGKIADTKGRSRWITSKPARQFVHRLRARNDAVMIGVNTLLKDDPLLTNRMSVAAGRQPVRVILDTDLRTPLNSRVFNKCGEVIIAGGKGASARKKALLEKKGANVILLPRKNNRVDIIRLMRYLAGINVMSVLCEGGGELSASLLKNKLVDEALFFVSPRIIGGRTAPTSCEGDGSDIRKSSGLRNVRIKRIGPDILIRGDL